MESLGVIRALWRHRVLVALVAALSLAAALFSLYRVGPGLESRATTYGLAHQRVLVDSPRSLAAAARVRGALSITTVAQYLGEEMTGRRGRLRMAHGIGLDPTELAVVSDEGTLPRIYNPLAQRATEVARPRKPYSVSVQPEPNVPILMLTATAPDQHSARSLVAEGPAALREVARNIQAPAGAVRVERLGGPEASTREAGPSKVRAMAVGLGLFVFGCLAVAVLDRLRSPRRDPAWPEARHA